MSMVIQRTAAAFQIQSDTDYKYIFEMKERMTVTKLYVPGAVLWLLLDLTPSAYTGATSSSSDLCLRHLSHHLQNRMCAVSLAPAWRHLIKLLKFMTVAGAVRVRRALVAAVLLVEVVLTYVRLLDKYYILSHLRSVLF